APSPPPLHRLFQFPPAGLKLLRQLGIEHMVLPAPGDAQVAPRQPLLTKAQLFQKAAAGGVAGQAGGLGAVKAERPDDEVVDGDEPVGHVALAAMGPADPVPGAAALGDRAAQVADGDAAQELLVARPQEEEAVAPALPLVALVVAQAPAIGAAGQGIGAPGGLPGLQEGAALLAQAGPGAVVAAQRRAQAHAPVA